MSKLVDFHVHIDYYKNYEDIYQHLTKHRIYTLFVTNLPEIYERCRFEFQTSKYVRVALGYNPQLVNSHPFNKTLFDKYLSTTKFVGEVGLDYSKEYVGRKVTQVNNFKYICDKAGQANKILSVHSRMAEEDTLELLKNHGVRFAVFHWYSGPLYLIDDIVKNGYYFSVNYSMLRSAKGLKIINSIPKERLLIETDGPFGKSPVNGYDLNAVYTEFHKILGYDVRTVIFENFKLLLSTHQDYELT